MVGMLKLQSDGHIVVLGRLLHKSFRIFQSILGLWQEMGKEFGYGKICGGGINLQDSNNQDYLEQSRIKISLFLQFSVLLALSLGTLIFVVTFSIQRQKIQNVSCNLLTVCIYPLRLRCEILVFIFFRIVYSQVFLYSLVPSARFISLFSY